ncbi:MAG: hypothetical protein EOT05_02860 [Candidatus Microsaccharimonas sossegonensis]|uniref:Methanolan biosynthesis EpsI domain-containing protein n=1 Tax=Candidatus Microsaccharimonas sossegonensis TaxID=2506948 RepID=A0A4Q0AHR4_9BACT|nr:MAG: hypothetical protein EOT05_02860 [Candidatus Microsaccharimonas sossegonensis]
MRNNKRLKIILVSLLLIMMIAGMALAAFAVFLPQNNKRPVQPATAPLPGSMVALDKAPSLQTCKLLSNAQIQSSLGASVTTLTNGKRQAVVANTGKIAENCEYVFKTSTSTNNSLALQTYVYDTADQSAKSKEVMGPEWVQLTYTKKPSYFNQDTKSDSSSDISTLRVIVGAYNYLFVMRQEKGKTTFGELEARAILVSLSEKANFALTTPVDPNAPPAPNVPDKKV